ncbi:lipoprotein insertase outer membrane protein LolB [Parendozoicomonas haliclonae]|nr:lipoprotein insertase outer membrane protein LolB [Parendozoicomonas haliclonae]
MQLFGNLVRKRLPVVAVLSLLFLAGCASNQRITPAPDKPLSNAELEQAWQHNLAQARKVDSWHVSGRAGVKTPQQSGAVTISWDRSPETFSIYMTGPLGQTLARLEGQGKDGDYHRVSLDVPGNEPVVSGSAEQLLYLQTGWMLPFTSLDYWMRGMPAPGNDYVRVLNERGYLAELHQNGWKVSYGSYRDVSGVQLPEKVRATREGVAVILSIKEWELP